MTEPPNEAVPGESAADRALADELIAAIARSGQPQEKEHQVEPTRSLTKRTKELDELRMADHQLDLTLKRVIGYGAPLALAIQLVIVNVVLITAIKLELLNFSDRLAIAWLTSTIVEVIGVVLVVAKYLFPGTGSRWNEEPEKERLRVD